MDLDDNETRLLLCLEALCDSLFRDDEWAEFRRDCCELDVEQWHSLNSVLGEELGDIWDDMSLEAPSLWLRISLTPCGRWRICNLYCAELTAVVATALLGFSDADEPTLH